LKCLIKQEIKPFKISIKTTISPFEAIAVIFKDNTTTSWCKNFSGVSPFAEGGNHFSVKITVFCKNAAVSRYVLIGFHSESY